MGKNSSLIVTGIVLLLGIIIFLAFSQLPTLFSSTSVEDEISEYKPVERPESDNPYFKDIDEAIKSLGKSAWSKSNYQKIKTDIETNLNTTLIKQKEHDYLTDKLNLNYITTLNTAAKEFFKNSLKASKIAPIRSELNRLSRNYKSLTYEMQLATANFGKLQGLVTEINNSIGDITTDSDQLENYFSQLDDLKERKHLNYSPLVAQIVTKSKTSLGKKLASSKIDLLNIPVNEYITQKPFDENLYNAFKADLSELKNNQYISSSSDVINFFNQANQELEEHKSFSGGNFRAKMKYNINGDSAKCSVVFTKYNFYVNECLYEIREQ